MSKATTSANPLQGPIRPVKQETRVSDVQDEAYFDPLALVNCWELALHDLKMQHPDRFLPPTEAPLAHAQKQTKAPLWYGPPPLPPVASTSKATSTATAARSPLPSFDFRTSIFSSFRDPDPESSGPKKRKRLTGSQKKARKQARLLTASAPPTLHAADDDDDDNDDDDDVDDDDNNNNGRAPFPRDPPPHVPSSHQLAPEPHATARGPPPPPPPPLRLAPPPPPVAAARMPTSFPSPPPITPLTGDEPPLDAETPEQLLEAALWSWFTCGYQTALYHASVGVATFRPSEAEPEGAAGGEGTHGGASGGRRNA
ncbi:hypothetical protein JCM21900_005501 [Sporobolomyces salmonicolor]